LAEVPVLRLLFVALGCIAAGCGASDRAPDVAGTAERFHAALEARDAEVACQLLAPETQRKLEQQEAALCEEAILALELPEGARAVTTSVHMTSASVALAEGGSTFLDEFDDGWKVSAAGCTPGGPDLPYECELEG
jgi:hypothetical protein